jgi:hypothetical protein
VKIRTTENDHTFQKKLFERLNAYQLQGLLINSKDEFSAGVEAVQYEDYEEYRIPFSEEELWAKYILTKEIGIPMYLVYYWKRLYYILKVNKVTQGKAKPSLVNKVGMNEDDFARWWKGLKGMPQTKHLNNGANVRTENTVFDGVLRRYGLEWGGNIDGFILSNDNKKVLCVVDNISVSVDDLRGNKADPGVYFHSSNPKHGPRYEGWYGAVKLSNQLKVPHMLLTIDKRHPELEHVGMTFIDDLSPDGLSYIDNISPNKRVIDGIANIRQTYAKLIKCMHAPTLKRKED